MSKKIASENRFNYSLRLSMQKFLLIISFLFLVDNLAQSQTDSGDPSEMFLNAYMAVQQADRLEAEGKYRPALAKYRFAASLLGEVQVRFDHWQPVIVDYRKRRTGEKIASLESKLGREAADTPRQSGRPPAEAAPGIEGPLPQLVPEGEPTVSVPTNKANQGDVIDQAAQEIRNRLTQLQNQLKESQAQLQAVQDQKEGLAIKLNKALEENDQRKVSETEAKAKLTQLKEALQNSSGDTEKDSASRKVLQDEIGSLHEELKNAKADAEAAKEVTELSSKRPADSKEDSQPMQQVLQQLEQAKTAEAEAKKRLAEIESLPSSDEKQVKALQLELKDARANLEAAEQESAENKRRLAIVQKGGQENQKSNAATRELTERLAESEAQVASLKKDRGQNEQLNQKIKELEAKISQSRKQQENEKTTSRELLEKLAENEANIANITKQRDIARNSGEELEAKLAASQKLAATSKQSAQAMETKVKELETKLATTEKSAPALKEARQQIAALKKEREEAKSAKEELDTRLKGTQQQIDTLTKQRDTARFSAENLGGQLQSANKQVQALTKERDAVSKTSEEMDNQIADQKKLVESLTKERDKAKSSNQELATQLSTAKEAEASAQKETAKLKDDNNAVRKSNEDLSVKLETAQAQVKAANGQRDLMSKQRDETFLQLGKAKEAQQQLDKLIADNALLMQKLADAESMVKSVGSKDESKKDAAITSLRTDLSGVRQQLAAAQQQSQSDKNAISDLQAQLERNSAESAQLKSDKTSTEDRKKLAEENELLRDVVLRQLKEQARREQAKKLIFAEMEKLEGKSTTLMTQIDYLAQPVTKLTDKEKALFKLPQIEISEAESPSAEISITAALPTAAKTGTTNISVPAVPETAAKAPSPAASPSPAGTPANATQDELPVKDTVQQKTDSTSAGAPTVETSIAPTVPKELLPMAREAKDSFERGDYREAEKSYERILSKVPSNIYALSNLGVVRFRAGKLKLAEETFKKALAISPEDSFSHCTLGIVFYSEGKYDDAVNSLTKSLAINSKNAIAHNYLGIAASQKGWMEAAVKELDTAIALDPNYADAHFNMAVIYATQQPPNKLMARKFYQRATKLGAEADSSLETMIK